MVIGPGAVPCEGHCITVAPERLPTSSAGQRKAEQIAAGGGRPANLALGGNLDDTGDGHPHLLLRGRLVRVGSPHFYHLLRACNAFIHPLGVPGYQVFQSAFIH